MNLFDLLSASYSVLVLYHAELPVLYSLTTIRDKLCAETNFVIGVIRNRIVVYDAVVRAVGRLLVETWSFLEPLSE